MRQFSELSKQKMMKTLKLKVLDYFPGPTSSISTMWRRRPGFYSENENRETVRLSNPCGVGCGRYRDDHVANVGCRANARLADRHRGDIAPYANGRANIERRDVQKGPPRQRRVRKLFHNMFFLHALIVPRRRRLLKTVLVRLSALPHSASRSQLAHASWLLERGTARAGELCAFHCTRHQYSVTSSS